MPSWFRWSVILVIVLGAAVPAAAQFTGTWEGTYYLQAQPHDDAKRCLQSGLMTMTLSQGSGVSGSVTWTFSKNPETCAPLPLVLTSAITGTVSGNVLTGTLVDYQSGFPFTATYSSGALFFSNLEDDFFYATLFSPATANASVNVTGAWTGDYTGVVPYCEVPLNVEGPMVVTLSQSGSTFAGTVAWSFLKDVDRCQLLETPSGTMVLDLAGTIDGNTFIGAVTYDDPDDGNFVGAITGSVTSDSMQLSMTLPASAPHEANDDVPLDSIYSATLTRPPAIPPVITAFAATPNVLVTGGATVLSWTTSNASGVTLNGTPQPLSGSVSASPAATTTYVLIANGPGGPPATRTITVIVNTPPNVIVSAYPSPMVQPTGDPLPSTRYTLTNLGGTPTMLTLTQTETFFTQTPTTFLLGGNSSRVVVITATAQPNGFYTGFSNVSGNGASGLSVPVRLLVVPPPTSSSAVTSSGARQDFGAPAGQDPSGSVPLTNNGASLITGVLSSDVSWINIQVPFHTIAPGQTTQVPIAIIRSLRPDGDAPIGGVFGTVTFSYVNTAETTGPVSNATVPTVSKVTVVIVDVVTLNTTPGSIPPLNAGDLAYFLTGASSKTAGDLTLSNAGLSAINDFTMYYSPFGGAPGIFAPLGNFGTSSGIAFPGVIRNIFNFNSSTASLTLRSTAASKVSVAQTQTDTERAVGYAVPVFRSDEGVDAGQSILLPGVEKSASMTTTLYVQEVLIRGGSVRIDFLNAAGIVIGGRNETLNGAIELQDIVPAGASTVRVTNTSPAGTARFNAYALVTDTNTRDGYTIVDIVPASGDRIVPVFSGTPTDTHLHLANASDAEINIAAENVSQLPRRRAIAHSSSSNIIPAHGSSSLQIAEAGFVRLSGSSALRAAGWHHVATSTGSIGAGIAAIPVSRALAVGASKRFTGIDDSAPSATTDARRLSYRTNLMLVETSGHSVTVRLTLSFQFSTGKVSATTSASREVTVPAGRYSLLSGVAESIIGAPRKDYGDLRNAVLDIEVIGGAGSVLAFLQSIDNGSGDVTIRHE